MIRVLRLFAYAALLLAMSVPARAQGGAKKDMTLKTVVIDAGHGGKDTGGVSKDKQTYEKTIALDVSKRVAQKIQDEYPDVKVLMTRKDDRFIELEKRASFANKAEADLFICIHVDAVDSPKAHGYSIHCLGQSSVEGNDLFSKNLDLVKRENSVILLEDDYETKYQNFDPTDPQSYIMFNLMQNAHLAQSLVFAEDVANAMANGPITHSRGVSQNPFWVLWRTAMPAALIEIGFITNDKDLAVMRTEEGRDQIADNIFRAFCTFKSRYDGSMSVDKKNPTPVADKPAVKEVEKPAVKPEAPKEEAKPEVKPETPKEEVKPVVKPEVKPEAPKQEPKKITKYGVQVLVSSTERRLNDPYFGGYTPTVIKVGQLNKYIIGVSTSSSEVREFYTKVQKKYPDSFIVSFTE